jgi:signal transduction histidine kinase
LVFDTALAHMALLISPCRRAFSTRVREGEYTATCENLRAQIRVLEGGRGDLLRLIPFVLGKTHNLSLLVDQQRSVVHSLVHLKQDETTSEIRNCLLSTLEKITGDLKVLYDGMKSVASIGNVRLIETELPTLIEEVLRPFRIDFMKERIHVHQSWPPSGASILCDPSLIRQVFYNLTDNSRKALSFMKGGRKLIRIIGQHVEHGVQIIFWDNGGGIEDKNLPDVFRPYFSTRPGGTGLGLYFVKRIVEVHGGTITFKSHWGRYMAFRIFLPSVPPVKGSSEPAVPPPTTPAIG